MKKVNKYLKITNAGEIDPLAFTLIGASTKRGDNDKIGFFGSGLKYSIAYLLRNEIPFTCFAGMEETTFSVEKQKFRDEEFGVICVNDKPTSMTTGMGIDWKLWFIIREIYCNAIDEGGEEITTTNDYVGEVGKTVFYITINEQIQELIEKWDDYFSKDRDGLLYSDKDMNGLYTGGDNTIVYRKGIRCFEKSEKSLFHYDMSWIKINESRVIDDQWDFRILLRDFFQNMTDKKIIKKLLRDVRHSWEGDLYWNSGTHQFSDAWLECIGDKVLVEDEHAGLYVDEMAVTPHLILPRDLCQGLKDKFDDEITIMGMMDGVKPNEGIRKIEVTPRMEFLLKKVEDFLIEVEYDVKYPITICSFDRQTVFGQALDGKIYLSEKLFEMGQRDIAKVIIEENEHLITGFNDETRQFQDHFINKYFSALEERFGNFL